MKPTAFIGVDPGATGYVCLLAPAAPMTIEYCKYDNPPKYILDWVLYMDKLFSISTIMIEDVHSLHMMSAKSNFMFGHSLGAIQALCRASGLGVDKVAPKVWQRTIGIKPKSKTIKKDVAKIAHTLYPTASLFGPKGGLIDGKSDSLMIAHHTFKMYTK